MLAQKSKHICPGALAKHLRQYTNKSLVLNTKPKGREIATAVSRREVAAEIDGPDGRLHASRKSFKYGFSSVVPESFGFKAPEAIARCDVTATV